MAHYTTEHFTLAHVTSAQIDAIVQIQFFIQIQRWPDLPLGYHQHQQILS